jgi:hypothetical protein
MIYIVNAIDVDGSKVSLVVKASAKWEVEEIILREEGLEVINPKKDIKAVRGKKGVIFRTK